MLLPNSPEVKERLAGLGADASPTMAAEFDKIVAAEVKENAELARRPASSCNSVQRPYPVGFAICHNTPVIPSAALATQASRSA